MNWSDLDFEGATMWTNYLLKCSLLSENKLFDCNLHENDVTPLWMNLLWNVNINMIVSIVQQNVLCQIYMKMALHLYEWICFWM